ncbi:MAG TPA: FMN-binding protein [Mobilitalea sp.]|nr:FMN-binding protein [Mobilitalea sp.]
MSKKKKFLIAISTFVVVVAVLAVVVFSVISNKLESFSDLDISALDMNTIEDGTYIGSADASIVKATVEVTVKDHVITEVKLVKHANGQGKPAEVIVNDIVAANSLQVDVISGATYSSNIIKAAVLDALTK